MKGRLILLVCTCSLIISLLARGQDPTPANGFAGLTYNLTISSTETWVDTRIDLHPGDALQINAFTSTGGCSPTGAKTSQMLDTELCKKIDALPRRVNDQFHNLGDMVNFVIVGSAQQVQSAFEAASWRLADKSVEEAVINVVLVTYQKKDYLQMPMSTLYLFNRAQDFGYELAEAYSVVASRHHFRLWKAPFTWSGQGVWVGAGTHDIGFEKDQRNGKVTHKIDPAVDGERDYISETLGRTGKIKSMNYHLPPNPIYDAKNATGAPFRSDGRLLVIFLQ